MIDHRDFTGQKHCELAGCSDKCMAGKHYFLCKAHWRRVKAEMRQDWREACASYDTSGETWERNRIFDSLMGHVTDLELSLPLGKATRRAKMSRSKGARGEREWAEFVRDKWGFHAYRGRQFSGHPDTPDVKVPALAELHFEVKRQERPRIEQALDQALQDCAAGQVPVVVYRKNKGEWYMTHLAKDAPVVAYALERASRKAADADSEEIVDPGASQEA